MLLLACFLSSYPLDGSSVSAKIFAVGFSLSRELACCFAGRSRSPRPDNGFSEHTTLKMIESEVASIKFSKLNGIPVVKVKSHW